jgi:hypothetical protein
MTKHKVDCKRIFKKYDSGCPRCQELMNGSTPRKGWQYNYYRNKKQQAERFRNALKNHNCKESNCGPVCTFGDW